MVSKCTHLGTHRKENIFMKRYGYHNIYKERKTRDLPLPDEGMSYEGI